MSKHRYLLPDGRRLLINDPAFSGRAYFYVDGDYVGEYTIHELKITRTFILNDESQLKAHVVDTVPGFRLFDVRHNGIALAGSAADPKWSRRTVMEILLLSAIIDLPFHLPESPLDFLKVGMAAAALLVAVAIWRQFDGAPSFARKLMLVRCALLAFHVGEPQLNFQFDLVSFGLYVWMRHLTEAIDYAPEIDLPTRVVMPQVTLT